MVTTVARIAGAAAAGRAACFAGSLHETQTRKTRIPRRL
jgi:hypothetical protein